MNIEQLEPFGARVDVPLEELVSYRNLAETKALLQEYGFLLSENNLYRASFGSRNVHVTYVRQHFQDPIFWHRDKTLLAIHAPTGEYDAVPTHLMREEHFLKIVSAFRDYALSSSDIDTKLRDLDQTVREVTVNVARNIQTSPSLSFDGVQRVFLSDRYSLPTPIIEGFRDIYEKGIAEYAFPVHWQPGRAALIDDEQVLHAKLRRSKPSNLLRYAFYD